MAWLLGLGVTAFLIRRVGPAAIVHALARVGPRFIWIVIAYAAATAVGAIPWGLLLPRRARPSWGAVLTSRFAASGLAAVLPFFGIGEAGRLLWMPRPARPNGTAAIVVDRLIFLVAGALFLLGAVGSARSLGSLPAGLTTGAVVVALSIVVGVVGVAVVAAHGQLGRAWNGLKRTLAPRHARAVTPPPLGPVAPIIEPILPIEPMLDGSLAVAGVAAVGVLESPRAADRAWEPALRAMLVGPRRPLIASLSVHLVSRLLFALEIYAGLRLLGLPSGWRETSIFAAVPIALSVAGTFIPGQLGLQEGVQALVAAALGIGPAAGLTLVLLQRVRQLLFVPLSGLLIAMVTRGDRGSEA
jgi:hypothetical protein